MADPTQNPNPMPGNDQAPVGAPGQPMTPPGPATDPNPAPSAPAGDPMAPPAAPTPGTGGDQPAQ